MDMDRYEGMSQRGRSKLSRFRVRRDPSVESGERQVRNDFEGSLKSEGQDGLRDGSARKYLFITASRCMPRNRRSSISRLRMQLHFLAIPLVPSLLQSS